MESSLISVIVPVYNQEKYLDRCVQSILLQEYSNLEIILVDDGSSDSSGRICDFYKELDQRVHVIHQQNQGVSSARNAGLACSNGLWISFVDSDDSIRPDHFKRLINATRTAPSIKLAICDFSEIQPNNLPVKFEACSLSEQETSYSFLEKLWDTPHTYSVCVVAWNKLYHCSLFKSLLYRGNIYEDEDMLNKLYKTEYKIAYSNCPTYYYYQTPGSLIRSSAGNKQLYFLNILKERNLMFLDLNMKRMSSKTQSVFLDIYGEILAGTAPIKKQLIKKYRSTYLEYFTNQKRSFSLKSKLRYFLIGLVPNIYALGVNKIKNI